MLFRIPGKMVSLATDEIPMPCSDESWGATSAELWLQAHQLEKNVSKMDLQSVCDSINSAR
jgi:hypothetical protein